MSTPALAAGTGNPPAIRWDDLVHWTVLADNIESALKMGGEQGMDLLLGVMADWCRIVDEINTAYQICVELAERGLRDEALQWHAEGFFDIADRLDPNRPGWEEWEKALLGRGVIVPTLDAESKALVEKIFDDLTAMHINGQVLKEEVCALRRNMLVRGDLAERLTILNRLQEIDETSQCWRDMLRPYRQRRAGELAGEVAGLVAAKDSRGLCRLNVEVERQNWGDEIPAEVRATLSSAGGWVQAESAVAKIRREVSELVGRCRQGQNADYGSAAYQGAINSARTHRSRTVSAWRELKDAMNTAEACPQIRKIIRERNPIERAQGYEAQASREATWLSEQDSFEEWMGRFRELDEAIYKRLRKDVKFRFPEFDGYKKSVKKWLSAAEDLIEYARKLCTAAPMIPKASEELCRRLTEMNQAVKLERDRVIRLEWYLYVGFFGGLFSLVIGAIIIAILVQ